MRNKFCLFLLSSILVIAEPADASSYRATPQKECTTVGLSAPLGPNRSQGDIGWCYANTAADLITYHFQDELIGARASAVYIALAYSTNFENGGLSSLAIVKAQSSGFCPMSSEEDFRNRGPSVGLKEKLKNLIELKKRYDASGGKSLAEDMKLIYEPTNSILATIPKADLINIFENSTPKTIAKKLADYFCQGDRIYPKHFAFVVPKSKYLYGGSTKELMSTIHEQLGPLHKNILSISYFTDFFEADGAKNTNASRHVSVVVGRRWNQNRCEIQIRNSWGSSCAGYKAASLKAPGMCVDGNIWVPEETLANAIFGVTYIMK